MKPIIKLMIFLVLLPAVANCAAPPAVKEFLSGNRITFSTAGHHKSNGINLNLSYPNSWLAKEGERPHIVQNFVSERGRGFVMAMIGTWSLELPPGTTIPENEWLNFFTPSEMKRMVPEGANFIQAKPTKIEGLPAGILEYSMRQDRAGLTIDGHFISYTFVYDGVMVQLICSVSDGQSSRPDLLAKKMNDLKPLFTLMANSIVLQDRWK
jgi:hypothetical protein